jgi:hypothetical protein
MTLPPDLDIYSAGRDASAKTRALFDGRAFFAAARRLEADGSCSGPAEASWCLADEEVVRIRGGLPAAREVGVNTVVCGLDGALAPEVIAAGLRCLLRVPLGGDEAADDRRRRLDQLAQVVDRLAGIDGFMPVPTAPAQGLHALVFFAGCRQAAGRAHLVVDLDAFGHKLGQLCLSFGADEILGPIVVRRALRLGEHAASSDITRDEAAQLLRAAGFLPCERLPDGGMLAL